MLLTPKTHNRLKQIAEKAKRSTLFGTAPDGSSWSEYCSKYALDTIEWDKNSDEKERKGILDLYRGAHEGDKDARHELQTLRIETTQNYLIPVLHFGRFFEVINLGEKESPAIQNTTKNEFKVFYLGQDGGEELKKAAPEFSETTVDLFPITTETVEYPLYDLYRGRIADAATKTFDLNFDMENGIDGNLYTLLNGSFGAFTTTGARAARTYALNSRIRASIIPTTNELGPLGVAADGTTKFGQTSLDAVMDYAACWPADSQGELKPTGNVLIPADQVSHSGSGITITGQKQNQLAERIADIGWYGYHYNGVDWTFIPDHTLPLHKAIFQLNRPVGYLWFKPFFSQDKEEIDEKAGQGKRWIKKVIGTAVTAPAKRNVARVTYRTGGAR